MLFIQRWQAFELALLIQGFESALGFLKACGSDPSAVLDELRRGPAMAAAIRVWRRQCKTRACHQKHQKRWAQHERCAAAPC